ncbi:unnamed protein product, partial [Amoebophrya sp. A120]
QGRICSSWRRRRRRQSTGRWRRRQRWPRGRQPPAHSFSLSVLLSGLPQSKLCVKIKKNKNVTSKYWSCDGHYVCWHRWRLVYRNSSSRTARRAHGRQSFSLTAERSSTRTGRGCARTNRSYIAAGSSGKIRNSYTVSRCTSKSNCCASSNSALPLSRSGATTYCTAG